MDSGKLVPEDVIFEIIGKTLAKPECTKVMFDGFPRTLDQAKKV
jgi:adenylate kinase family enzyme